MWETYRNIRNVAMEKNGKVIRCVDDYVNNNLLHTWSWMGSQKSLGQGFWRCFSARKVGDNDI